VYTFKQIPWVRIIAEGAAIVISILLAFAIDTWWDERKEIREEFHALQMLDSDLSEAIRLFGYVQIQYEIIADASIEAYAALSSDQESLNHKAVEEHISNSMWRRTIRVPQAAYTELISTGDLRVIRDSALRNKIIEFYASVESLQSAVEKTTIATEKAQQTTFILDGLILPYPVEIDIPVARTMVKRNKLIQERLGTNFVPRPQPLWSYSPGSREWDRVLSVLLATAMGAQTNFIFTDQLEDEAIELKDLIQKYLQEARFN
jgi:hypothetical protein